MRSKTELPIIETINEFQQYMAFAHNKEQSFIGTIFYNVKIQNPQPQPTTPPSFTTLRFGFTIYNTKTIILHPLNEEHNCSTFSSAPIDIYMNEREFRDVFSGSIQKSALCTAIMSGRIYVSPWNMKSVYNFGLSFEYDRWKQFFEMRIQQQQQQQQQ